MRGIFLTSSTKLLNTSGEAQSVFSTCWRNGGWKAHHSRETAEKDLGLTCLDCLASRLDGLLCCVHVSPFRSIDGFVFICTLLTLNISSHCGKNLAWWLWWSWGSGLKGSWVSWGLCVRSNVIWGRAEVFQGCFCGHSSNVYCSAYWFELSSLLPF